MKIYTDKYGTKTSKEIEAILDKVHNYLNNGSKTSYTTKCNSVKMLKLRMEFEALFTDKCEDGFRITSEDVKMNTHTQKEDFRSDFVLNSIINDVEIKGQRKTIAYYGAKAEIQRKNEYKLSTIRVRNSSTQNY